MTELDASDRLQLGLDLPAPRRFAFLRAVAIATMFPFAKVEELLFSERKYGGETVNRYVVFVGEEAEELVEFPSVFALRPHRETLLFPANYPIPLLGYRSPFISPSNLVTEGE